MRTRGVRGGGGGSSVCVCLLAPCDSAAAPVSGEFSSEPLSAHSPTASRVLTAAGLPGLLAGWPGTARCLCVGRPALQWAETGRQSRRSVFTGTRILQTGGSRPDGDHRAAGRKRGVPSTAGSARDRPTLTGRSELTGSAVLSPNLSAVDQ